MTDSLFESMPLSPVDLPDAFAEFEEPAPQPRWSAPAPAVRQPSYGLVGMPASTVTTRDVKLAFVSFSLGAAVVSLFTWLGCRRG